MSPPVPPAPGTIVIALGGNAVAPPGERPTISNQFRHTRASLAPIVDLAAAGWNIVLVHGNGPQVGDELARNEIAGDQVEPLPLGVLVAASRRAQSRLGSLNERWYATWRAPVTL